jgi:chromate reductase, NAD(P)H dehydrogenase (quinone)
MPGTKAVSPPLKIPKLELGDKSSTMKVIKVLGICGSLKSSSVNMAALKYMASQAEKVGVEFEIADLAKVPFFNVDDESNKTDAVKKLLAQIEKADAFVLSSPEYNYSYAPALKNALDWGSRLPGNVGFKGKPASMISAGGGLKGGRAQYHLRQVGVFLDLFFVNKPEVMLSAFDGTFDMKTGELISEDAKASIVLQLEALKALALKLNP